jgi:3-hydroxyisobutyrate dehydrogenase-like beta-hydroxyacid dehydrogenase
MAMRLLTAGRLTSVWNRTRARATSLVEQGAIHAERPADAVRDVDIIALCLTDGAAVEDVVFGPTGFIDAVDRVAPPLILDFSTSSPQSARQLADRYARIADGAWVDAPVSGGVERARQGALIAYCGGSADAFAEALPILNLVASRATLLGPVGSGQAAKLVAQIIAAPTLVAIAEALATAEALGLDATRLIDTYTGGLIDSPLLQIFGRRMATGCVDPPIGAVGTLLKDIENALRMAQSAGKSPPLATAAAEILRRVATSRGATQELTALLDYVRTSD